MLDYKAILNEAFWMAKYNRTLTTNTRDDDMSEFYADVVTTTEKMIAAMEELMAENERLKAENHRCIMTY